MKSFLLVFFTAMTMVSFAQTKVFLDTATPSGDTLHCSGGNSNKNAVAYNPNFQLYYSNNAGGSVIDEYYDVNGNFLGSSTYTDWRGMWFNPNTNVIEGNTWSQKIVVDPLDTNGYFSNNTMPHFISNAPFKQATGDYDYDDNKIFYYYSDSLFSISRVDGSVLPTMPLTGLASFANISPYIVMYTGVASKEIGIYDRVDSKIYLFDKNTGVLTDSVQMPANVPNVSNSTWGFSLANDIFWLYDASLNKWIGYKIYGQGTNVHDYHIAFSIFPNPTNGIVKIETDVQIQSIEIISITGKRIASFTSKTFDMSHLQSGIYFVKVRTSEGLGVQRIVKR